MSFPTEMEVYMFMKKHLPLLSMDGIIQEFLKQYPVFELTERPEKLRLYARIKKVFDKVKKLKQAAAKKENAEKLQKAETIYFLPRTPAADPAEPQPSTSQPPPEQTTPTVVSGEVRSREITDLHLQVESLKKLIAEANSEAAAWRNKYETAAAELASHDIVNARRRERTHKALIVDLRKKNHDEEQKNKNLLEQIQALQQQVGDLRIQLEAEESEKTSLKKNLAAEKIKVKRRDIALQKQKAASDEEIRSQWSRIRKMQKSNSELQKLLDHCEANEVQTFSDGVYTIPIREVVLHLVKLNVAHNHISSAIKLIIEKLTPQKVGRLPSYGTINNIVHEAKCLALLQAGQSMLMDDETPANILLEDGTTKKRTKYNAIVVGTSTGLKNIGLATLASEDAETLVAITKETVSSIAGLLAKLENGNEEEITRSLYTSIKGTMSDSCAVMKKFHRLINSEIGEHADNANQVRNHYCFLHVIINLGEDACAHGLVDIDNCCYPPEVFAQLHSKTSSTTYSAILLAARMFHRMGSEKYGRADMFEAFLGMDTTVSPSSEGSLGKSRRGTQLCAKTSYFEREVGNRAHITFHNGNALWFHRKQIMEFLELQQAGSKPTDTIKTLYNLLKMKVPLASARALGIIKCCITGPFQHAFDVICSNIYEMVPYTIKARDSIQAFSVDASSLLEDPQSIYPDIPMDMTELSASLFHDTDDVEMDSLTILALQLILKNLLIKFERYCDKYLSEFAVPTADERNDMRNCPLTNRACESVMAALDIYVKTKPNATPGFLESLIMLRSLDLEKVGGLPEVEKEKHWKIARKYSSENIASNKAKLRTILDSRRLMLEQQRAKVANKVNNQRVLIAKIMQEMSKFGGGWRTGETVDLELEKLQSKSLKKKALITHIQSMKHIYKLKDSLPSSKKKLLRTANQSVELLKKNLKELMLYAPLSTDLPDFDADEVTRISGTTVLSPEQRSLLLEERISILQERLLAQRQKLKKSAPTETADEEDVNEPTPSTSTGVKRTTGGKRSAMSKKPFMPDPLYLVGKRVEHTFLIKTPGKERRTRTVFSGNVISIVKPSIDPMYTKYKIRYDSDLNAEEDEEEEETEFIYDLLIDYINGDLKVIE